MAKLNSSGSDSQKPAAADAANSRLTEPLRRQNTALAKSYTILHQKSRQMETQINDLMKENLALKCENVRLKSDASTMDGMSRAQEKLDKVRGLLQDKLSEMAAILTDGLALSRPVSAVNEGHKKGPSEKLTGKVSKAEPSQRPRQFSRLSNCIEEEEEEGEEEEEHRQMQGKRDEVEVTHNVAADAQFESKTMPEEKAKVKAAKANKPKKAASKAKSSEQAMSSLKPEMAEIGTETSQADSEAKAKTKPRANTKARATPTVPEPQLNPKPARANPEVEPSGSDPFALSDSSTPPLHSLKRLASSTHLQDSPATKRPPLQTKPINTMEQRRTSRGKQVSYVLPSLKAKMRRPTEKLADAILEFDKEN